MKKKIGSIRVAILLMCCGNLIFIQRSLSQDFHLSQFDAFAQYLNPAMTGMFKGDFRANVQIRSQWASVIANPYQTVGVGFDMPSLGIAKLPKLKNFKWGAYILNESAGASKYNVFNFALSGAYDIAIKKNHRFATGLQLGAINKSVSKNDLYFGDQYSNQNGGGFTGNTSDVFNSISTTLPDLNAGIMYYYSKVQSRFNPFIGFSVFHINQPKEEFFNSINNLPSRFNINGGTKINITRQHQVNLYCLYMKQDNVNELDVNILASSFLRGRDDVCFIYGFGYRKVTNQDADVIQFGMKYKNYTCRVSYDINISQLQSYSNGRGGFEVSLIYIHNKPIKVPSIVCPRI